MKIKKPVVGDVVIYRNETFKICRVGMFNPLIVDFGPWGWKDDGSFFIEYFLTAKYPEWRYHDGEEAEMIEVDDE